MSKTLNIGMVGYGLMARAHSNARANVARFFDTGDRRHFRAVAGRNIGNVRQFADMWGYDVARQSG